MTRSRNMGMKILAKKMGKSDRHDRICCIRADGSVTEALMPRQGMAPHDLLHYLVETRMAFWLGSKIGDDALRLILWIYLRKAFGVPAKLSVSMRGAEALAVELAAAAIHAAAIVLVEAGWLTPPKSVGFQKRTRAAYAVNPMVFAEPAP